MADFNFPTREKGFPTLGVTTPRMTNKSLIKAGYGGWIVSEAQTLLNGGGGTYGSYHAGMVDGDWGPIAAQAARRAKFWLGYPRDQVDGKFGPALRSFLLPKGHPDHKPLPPRFKYRRKVRQAMKTLPTWFKPKPKSLGDRMYAIAKSQVGVHENPYGSNRVRYTYWYNNWFGPWCAMFLSWVADQAGSPRPRPGTRWASVYYMTADARAGRNGLHVVSRSNVKRGDFASYHFSTTYQHIGMFDRWVSPGYSFIAIEGNTSDNDLGSQDNGGIVAANKLRYVSNVHDFFRLEG